MQVNNNYQPSFKSGRVTDAAKIILRRRLLSESAADRFEKKFTETFKDSKFDFTLGAVSNREKELDIMIHYENPVDDEILGNNFDELYNRRFFRHETEGFIRCLFSSPYKFLERIKNIYEKEAVPFAENGYKYV